jgi:hypothetical protein
MSLAKKLRKHGQILDELYHVGRSQGTGGMENKHGNPRKE